MSIRVVKNSAKLDRISVFFPFNGFTIKLVSHIFALGSINFGYMIVITFHILSPMQKYG